MGWASCPSYKLGEPDAMGVNLSQNPSKISGAVVLPGMPLKRLVTLNWEALPPNGIPSQRLGTRQNLPSPKFGEGIKGWGKSTWNKGLNVIVNTDGFPAHPTQDWIIGVAESMYEKDVVIPNPCRDVPW
ncbi:hypothetical protein [Scytonema sp. PCC 10023]|uniref:hypothetical protein n=1 Tax=Scytonema sp. PCC 10023 TaxID=1680591 RepID=UPI0039C7263C